MRAVKVGPLTISMRVKLWASCVPIHFQYCCSEFRAFWCAEGKLPTVPLRDCPRRDADSVGGSAHAHCGIQPCQPVGVLVVGGFKKLSGPLLADQCAGGQHLRGRSSLGEEKRDLSLDAIDQKASTDRRSRRDGSV